jgi:hypothetical protein
MNMNKSFLRDPALAQTDAPVARFLSRAERHAACGANFVNVQSMSVVFVNVGLWNPSTRPQFVFTRFYPTTHASSSTQLRMLHHLPHGTINRNPHTIHTAMPFGLVLPSFLRAFP